MKTENFLPRQRFLAALKGEAVDRPPLAQVAALTPVELQRQTGCFMPEVHMNPTQLVGLSGAIHEVLGFDAVTFIINFFNEPAALGTRMEWGSPRALPMYVSHPWAEQFPQNIPSDFLRRPPLSTNLEALYLARQQYGHRVAVLGKVMGPLSMLQVMFGIERTMIGLIDEPDKIRQLLDFCVEILICSAVAQFEVGIDAILIGEGGAGAQMLSPDMYRDFLLAPHQRMAQEIPGPTILHMCGDITPRLDSLREVGMTCFNFDSAIDPSRMKEAAQGAFTLMGNVDTTDLLRAPASTIECQVKACLEAGIEIISPGCAVSPECPVSNFLAMASAVRKWTER